LKEEVKTDLENLCRAMEKLQERGIGAKTKLGWGRFKINENEKFCCTNNFDISSELESKGWKRCQS
jgi:CRISPR-associated protein Cmr2